MSRFSRPRLMALLRKADGAQSAQSKGKAWEDLITYLMTCVPGVKLAARNVVDNFASQEVDIALWNERHPRGFRAFHDVIYVEAKNWNSRVSSREVSVFSAKLRASSLPFGILVAANGITGDPAELTSAQRVLADCLLQGQHIILITRSDIAELPKIDALVELVKRRMCELAVNRGFVVVERGQTIC